jgi:hypothetical protein
LKALEIFAPKVSNNFSYLLYERKNEVEELFSSNSVLGYPEACCQPQPKQPNQVGSLEFLRLIFPIIQFEISSLMNWIFS